ncbi:hypothetical protein B0I21_104151 [Sphingobacterium paludis]|uniref:Uncharacterized protein n=1 Tax=Sphingobacterium paludis TaxID=1476465 RepID=A0A4R7D2J7_9SPHI|nr:hypothetical protein B0I21_104151 [Sphingobacterium paludis]
MEQLCMAQGFYDRLKSETFLLKEHSCTSINKESSYEHDPLSKRRSTLHGMLDKMIAVCKIKNLLHIVAEVKLKIFV